MIVVKTFAGLGNQMFMYAAARCLAHIHRTSLKIDDRDWRWRLSRQFGLYHFNLGVDMADRDDLKAFRPSLQRRLSGWLATPADPQPASRYREPHFHFDESFFSAPSDCYVEGYFQSEKYFAPIADIVRHEFTMKPQFVQHLRDKAAELRERRSVSVHIRRGDYVTNRNFWVLSADYYAAAIAYLRQRIPDLAIYYFSDTPGWVAANMQSLGGPGELVSGKITKTNIEDLYLMSQCQNYVIANSTFSWWGAWLSGNPEKIVIAPSRWFRALPYDTRDLIPDTWRVM